MLLSSAPPGGRDGVRRLRAVRAVRVGGSWRIAPVTPNTPTAPEVNLVPNRDDPVLVFAVHAEATTTTEADSIYTRQDINHPLDLHAKSYGELGHILADPHIDPGRRASALAIL
jgi:hypothetical protein